MKKIRKTDRRSPNFYSEYTDEQIVEELKKYKSLGDLDKNNQTLYKEIRFHRDRKLLDTIRVRKQWTKETALAEARKYKTVTELIANNESLHNWILKHGIKEEVYATYEETGSKYKRLIYAYEFPDNTVYVGLTFNMTKRNQKHMTKEASVVYKHIQETGLQPELKQLTELLDYKEASIQEGVWLNKYKEEGWTALNKKTTGGLGSRPQGHPSLEECIEIARQYTLRQALREEHRWVYDRLVEEGLLNDLIPRHNGYRKRIK